jgi:DNA polymerase-3 subunit gamma/tau
MAKRKPPTAAADAPAPTHEGYTVLARRYRPQQFAEIVGQEAVARALVNALQSNRVAHAYLFTGARGVGKTSTARILAKALNCINGPTPMPCGECDICKSIASGEDVDVLEIDAASNRGIDEVRDIRQNVQYRPGRARFKIYIIDEVHMLTTPAFNALLKTLEEPPPHVKFIFATTEVQKIPVTILSRCQRFDFVSIGSKRIVEHLRAVVKGEGLQADDEALEMVARRAAGSMRDAQSLLDQLLAFGGERLTSEQVHQLLGTAHDDRVAELATAVLEKQPTRALEVLAEGADRGLQLGELLDQLMEYWRDLMIVQCAGAEGSDLSVSPRHREALIKQAGSMTLDTTLAGLDVLSATRARLRGSNHGRVLVEMALVRLARLDNLVSLTQLADMLAGGARPPVSKPAAPVPRTTAPPSSSGRAGGVSPLLTTAQQGANAPRLPEPTPAATVPLTPENLPEIWAQVLARLGMRLQILLEKVGLPAISGPNHLVLRVAGDYNDPREFSPDLEKKVEKHLRDLSDQPWTFRLDALQAAATGQPTPASENPDQSPSRARRHEFEALKEKEPLIKRALELLEAQVVRVDDGFGAAPVATAQREDTDTDEA